MKNLDMLNKLRLSRTILFSNKGFSMGLSIMLIMCICLIGAMSIIPASIPNTFNFFRADYNTRDAYVYYSDFVFDVGEEFLTTTDPNIESVEQQKATFTHIKDPNHEIVYGWINTTSDATKMRFSSSEHAENYTDYPSCWVSQYFARTNDIHPGSIFEIETSSGYKKCFLSDVIISPETCHCYRSSVDWCEVNYIPYVYLDAADFDTLFNSAGLYNTAYLYFKDGIDICQQQTSLDNLIQDKNINATSSFISAESISYKLVERVTKAVSKTLEFVPIVILSLTLLCIFLFIRQIIIRSRKTSIILCDLGYSERQNRSIFYIYEFIILGISAIVGSILCYFLCQFFFDVFINSFSLPYMLFVFNFTTLSIYAAVIIIVLFLAVYLNYKFINVDTEVNTSRSNNNNKKSFKRKNKQKRLEDFIKKIKLKSVYVKYSITKIIRDHFRIIITSFCLACSIILTIIGVAMLFSYGATSEYTFDKYLCYNGTITFYDEHAQEDQSRTTASQRDAFKSKLDALDNVEKSELVLAQNSNIKCGSFDDSYKIKAIDDKSSLINLIDADYNVQQFLDGVVIDEFLARNSGVAVGDIVAINGVEFKINGIARECVNSTLYLSYDSFAKVMDESEIISSYVVKFKDVTKADDTYKLIEEIPGYLYKADLGKQREINDSSCEAIKIVTDLILVDALIVGLIIVLNTVLLNLYLRKHEYAVLECLGTKSKSYFKMSLVEFLFLYCLSMIIGAPIGYFGSDLCLYLMSTTNNIYIFIHQPIVLIVSMLITFIYIIIGVVLTTLKIRNAKFIQILNMRE